MERLLILEDRIVFEGKVFSTGASVSGEIVSTISMTGYQETIAG